MSIITVLKIIQKIVFLTLAFLLCACIHSRLGNKNFNRNMEVMVTSGRAYFDISGHISDDIFIDIKKDMILDNTLLNPVVLQGQRTINKKIILGKTEKFKYTLTTAEVVIMNIRSVDGNDVAITVFEYGKHREYKIDGKNKLGQTLAFRN
jgi:hypothetical protein